MGFFSDILDDVFGIDPNGGGIYGFFDNALGIDPNGGGIFPLLNSLGINVNAQDFYNLLNKAISDGLEYVILKTTGVSIQVDVKLFKTPNSLSGNNLINGGVANELFSGKGGNDTINGNAGNDILYGAEGNDRLNGGEDNDILIGGLGTDTLDGGNGQDTAIYSSLAQNITFLPTGIVKKGDGSTDQLIKIEKIIANASVANNTIDTSTIGSGGTINVNLATNALVINGVPNVGPFTVVNFDNVKGTNANDTITGDSQNNQLFGNGGNDYLDGGAGSDALTGSSGNDLYVVDSTGDVVIETSTLATEIDQVQSSISYTLGGNLENLTLIGTSAINGTGNALNNSITGNSANNTLNGGDGNDNFFSLGGDDIINGGNGNDQAFGGIGNDILNGEAGNDVLYGQDGNDILNGGIGNDFIVGDAGNDILTGAGGQDALVGGAGSDKFSYKTLTDSLLANFDVIQDFNANAGNDLFLVTTALAGFTNAGTVTTLDSAGISAKLTTTNFGANFGARFSFGSRTFVAINNGTAGFSATTDALVEVTGLTGTLGVSNFVTASGESNFFSQFLN